MTWMIKQVNKHLSTLQRLAFHGHRTAVKRMTGPMDDPSDERPLVPTEMVSTTHESSKRINEWSKALPQIATPLPVTLLSSSLEEKESLEQPHSFILRESNRAPGTRVTLCRTDSIIPHRFLSSHGNRIPLQRQRGSQS